MRFKPIGWQGVGLAVPQHWDLRSYRGDFRDGRFTISEGREPAALVRWWKTRTAVSFDAMVEECPVPSSSGGEARDVKVSTHRIELPAPEQWDPSVRWALFERRNQESDEPLDWLAVAQDGGAKRAAVWQVLAREGRVDRALVERIVAGLRLQRADEWLDWAFFEWSVQTPPGYVLEDASLAAGVCRLELSDRAAPSRRLRLLRYSAADAAMRCETPGVEDFRAWIRHTYAADLSAGRYEMDQGFTPAGLHRVRLLRRRSWWSAVEVRGLIPRLKRLPREIRLLWNESANKVYVIEAHGRPASAASSTDAEILDRVEQSMGCTVDVSCDIAPPHVDRADSATILRAAPGVIAEASRPGRLILRYDFVRPAGLRLLRLLAGNAPGRTITRRIELDPMGAHLWRQCQEGTDVERLIRFAQHRLHISRIEAELSVAAFVQSMLRHGLLRPEAPADS